MIVAVKRHLCNCVKKPEKNSGLQPGFISFPQFIYDSFHISLTLIYFTEHMNPQLTCSQRQWLHSSVGRASHRYCKVTGSNPVKVLNVFFQASLSNCTNCVSLLRSFLHFISFLQFIYDSFHISLTITSMWLKRNKSMQ